MRYQNESSSAWFYMLFSLSRVAYVKVFSLLLVCTLLCVSGSAQTGDEITGKWKSEEEGKPMQMEILKQNNNDYYSHIINDSSGHNRNGKTVITSLAYDAKKNEYKGRMQPPDINDNVAITVVFQGSNKLKLTARKMMMSKTLYFIRIR